MGIDEVGIDKVGIDEVGINPVALLQTFSTFAQIHTQLSLQAVQVAPEVT